MKKSLLLLITLVCTLASQAYYQAEQGRWLSRDSIEEKGGLNLYAFIANNPADDVDIMGNMGRVNSSAVNAAKNPVVPKAGAGPGPKDIQDWTIKASVAAAHARCRALKTKATNCYLAWIAADFCPPERGGECQAMDKAADDCLVKVGKIAAEVSGVL